MKKFFIFFVFILVLSCTLVFPETLEQILAKNYESRGGLEKLKAVKTMKSEGKIVIPIQNMELPATLWIKKPNKMRMEATFMEKQLVMAYDGTKAWMIVPMLGTDDAQEMPEAQAREIAQQAESMEPLVDYQEMENKLEYVGKEDMEGTEVYKLKMTKKNGRIIHFYLDSETAVEIKTSTYVKIEENEVLVETVLGDYKDVDGIMIPFSIETKVAGFGSRIVLESIKLNEQIDDTFFVMPPKKAQEEKK